MSLLADIIALTLGLAIGFLTATSPHGPSAALPPIWRFAVFLIVASFANGIFRNVLGLLVPLLGGPPNLAEVLGFIAGLILAVAIFLIYVRLGADRTTSGV